MHVYVWSELLKPYSLKPFRTKCSARSIAQHEVPLGQDTLGGCGRSIDAQFTKQEGMRVDDAQKIV